MNSKKQTYAVVIIGTGRIGTGFDAPDSPYVLTHAHAVTKNVRTKLAGVADIDASLGKKEAKRWATEFFSNVNVLMKKTQPDIVIVATPDQTHAKILAQVARFSPKLVVCEKPAVTTAAELKKIRKLYASLGIPLIVNYSRRFDAKVREVRSKIARGEFGRVIAASGTYTGTLAHNGSHMIDLARFLFGEMSVRKEKISFEKCPRFSLTQGDQNFYSIFEMDILTERARLRFTHSGMQLEVQKAVASPIYKKFTVLGPAKVSETSLHDALPELVRYAVALLDTKADPEKLLSGAFETERAVIGLAKGAGRK